VNQFAPNPIVTKVLIVVGIAHAILTIIISCYDIMNDEGDVLDAILDIVTSIAELVPLTGASDAREIKRTVRMNILHYFVHLKIAESFYELSFSLDANWLPCCIIAPTSSTTHEK
jgi:hypothetical protein